MFARKDFDRLAQHSGAPALTIYMPTHRAGEQTHNGHDAIVLKDALKDAREQFEATTDLGGADIDAIVAPVEALVNDANFWRNQSDALAIYATADAAETFALPIPMQAPEVHVGQQFHLGFAARMLAPGARWYVFAVTQNYNNFYECTRNSITPIRIGDLVPENMEEVLEIYEGSETLQHHGVGASAGAGQGAGAIFHGQGSNEDRRDERLGIYFRRIGNGVTDLIAGSEEPLVIVADDQHVAAIRAEIDYPHVVEASVKVHPNALDPTAIQAETWPLVQPIFDKTLDELQDKFGSASGGGTIVNGLSDVVPAATNGQVAALFVAETAMGRTGAFDAATQSVTFSGDAGGVDLLEQAIRQTVSHGGQVLYRLAEAIPDTTDGVSAVLRYQV